MSSHRIYIVDMWINSLVALPLVPVTVEVLTHAMRDFAGEAKVGPQSRVLLQQLFAVEAIELL